MDASVTLTSAAVRRECAICGRAPAGSYEVSLHGEVTCAAHPAVVRCLFCGRPHVEAAPAGWRPFSGPFLRCPACLVDAVETQHQARVHLPSVRRQMAEIGVELPQRVRVRIVSPDPAVATAGGVLLGLTERWIGDAGRVRVTGINIVAGLPPTHFGRAVAHEIGHAWLALNGCAQAVREVEEGVCELFAYAWLKRRRTRMAEALRAAMWASPDPVYGDGLRRVHAAARRDGIGTVLDRLLRTGGLV